MKQTPLYESHVALGAQIIDFSGWQMPIQYEGITKEHGAVRMDAGLFDCSHMGEILVTGPQADVFTNELLTNDIDRYKDGKCMYAMMLNEEGGIIDDLIVYRFSKEKFLWVVNASNREKDLGWIRDHTADYDVTVEDVSQNYGLIAIQGPKSQKILESLTKLDLNGLGNYSFIEGTLLERYDAIISRTGYTGELGYEIYANPEATEALWDQLLAVGAEDGLIPCGLGARDTLRFEAGMPLYGNEMDEHTNPYEAGLGFAVKMNKTSFIGKDALKAARDAGIRRKIIGVELLGKGIPRNGYAIFSGDVEIGHITTGYLSPTVGKSLANAMIDIAYAQEGMPVAVQIRKKMVEGVLIPNQFLKKYKEAL